MTKLKLGNYERKPDRLMLRRAQEHDMSSGTSWVRLLEMELESKVSNIWPQRSNAISERL